MARSKKGGSTRGRTSASRRTVTPFTSNPNSPNFTPF